jgi:predicted O-linked N-acetylglucosamine transferase (SPINDLY family)/predicted SAM-dependent methyltransferase
MTTQSDSQLLNFVISAPGFTYASGGVIVLYDLARIIHERGISCKIFDTSGSKLANNIFDLYVKPEDFNEYTVAIYSEVVVGNPLNTNYVIRWILCDLGINCPHDIYKTWGKDDLVYHYGSLDPTKSIDHYNILFPLTLSPELKNQDKKREGYCHVIRKAHKFHNRLTYVHPDDSLLLDDRLTRSELVEILNTKKYLISYDPYCYISCIAALCGCIAIVMPVEGKSEKEWIKSMSVYPILEQYKVMKLDGIAYGLEELEHAVTTLDQAQNQHKIFMQYGENTVDLLIGDIINLTGVNPDKKTALKNNKNITVEDIFHNTEPKYKNFNQPKEIQSLMAAQTYYHANNLRLCKDLSHIPVWLTIDYIRCIFSAPVKFKLINEAANYYTFIQNWMDYIHNHIFDNFEDTFWLNTVSALIQRSNFMPVYFNEENLKHIYIQRADIIKLYLENHGCEIEYIFPPRPANRKKIRLGIISNYFNPSAETFAALPVYEYLGEDFEVFLYSFKKTDHPLERYCYSCANSSVVLHNDLPEQVKTIREDELDILFFASNVTIIANPICLLATHRLARIQVTSNASVVTTGIKNMDYFLSGMLTDPSPIAKEQYREKLIQLPGTIHCFSYGDFVETSSIAIERQNLGIAENTIVFTSGANCYKIIPELIHTWAKIISAVPNSMIMLFPFGPNWSNSYQKQDFEKYLHKIFAEYGVTSDRVIALDPQPIPNREDLKKYFKLADIYLDSYPFAGTTSLIEPLQVGLPVIARQGNCFRSAMGAAMIQSLGISDLVADSEESYIQLAVNLGNNLALRQQKSTEVQTKMQHNPSFLDSRAYSAKIGELFIDLFAQYAKNSQNESLQLRDINLMVFPDWNQSEELVGYELQQVIQTLATQPNAQNTTLLIDTTNIATEDAQMFLSSIAMNIMMEEDLDITEELGISLIEDLNNIQWENLLPRINSRIVMDCDDRSIIDNLLPIQLMTSSLSNLSAQAIAEGTCNIAGQEMPPVLKFAQEKISLPQQLKAPIRLHIGGQEYHQDWKIFDALPREEVDFIGNAKDLSQFANDSISAIYTSHVLEHFHYLLNDELTSALKEWHRVLEPGGELMVSVPNLQVICSLYVDPRTPPSDRYHLMRMIFGGHLDEYDVHKVGFDQDILGMYLKNAGFRDLQVVSEFGLFNDCSSLLFGGVPISLNMIARK